MTLLALVYFLVFALPLLFGSWRATVVSLGVQAIVLAIVTAREAHSPEHAFEVFALGALRGVLVPAFLLRAVARSRADTGFEVVRGDALHWTLVLALVVASATFAGEVSSRDVPRAFGIATAGAEVLVGLLILATQTRPLGQILGALSIENGILFADVRASHHFELPVQLGITAVFVLLVLQLSWFLGQLGEPPTGAGSDQVL